MSENQIIANKFYFPSCQKCDGLLKITISPLNFSIDYECEKNENHKKSDIFFKTFERFYLKEKEIYECSNCRLCLDNSEFYKCETCKLVYCGKCIIEDIKTNNHKDIIFETNIQKCNKHNWNYNSYCFNCKKNICIYCTKGNNLHYYHSVKNYDQILPSVEEIEYLKRKLNSKIIYTNIIIEKIENWKKELIKKIEELKQNLNDEISFFSKVIFNYNHSFADYTYFNFFKTLNNYIKNFNNEYLLNFYISSTFETQTEFMNKLFKNLGKRKKEEEIYKKENKELVNIYSSKISVLEKINDLYFIIQDDYNNNVCFCFYTTLNNNAQICKNGKIGFKEKIYSFSKSTIENKVFACLLNSRIVKIFNYNIRESTLELSKSEINNVNFFNNGHFNKCIQININNYITSDDQSIIIWQNNNGIFIQLQTLSIFAKTLDILLANEDYFISSQPENKQLTLTDIKNYTEIKKISNIDCIDSTKCLFKIKDEYIIICCKKGFGLFLIKTKEIIQYIEYYDSYYNRISCDDNNNIYILNQKRNNNNNFYNSSNEIKIMIAKVIDNEIVFIKEINNLFSHEDQLEITSSSENIILLWKNNVYYIKEQAKQIKQIGFFGGNQNY